MTITSNPIRKVCAHCGSENVTHDALATWNSDDGLWEIITTLDNADCNRCGGECTIEDAPMTYNPWASVRPLDRVQVAEHGSGCFQVMHYPSDRSGAVLVDTYVFQQHADQAAKAFGAQFDDAIVVLAGEDYP